MKNLKITSLLFMLGIVVLSSCKDPVAPAPTAEEAQLALLIKTWNNKTVTFNDSADQGDWSAFKVTFADGSYTSSGVSAGRELVWPSTGTWSFKGAGTDNVDEKTIVRDDKVEIGITVDEASLTMKFTYDEATNGRTTGIDGAWVFGMTN